MRPTPTYRNFGSFAGLFMLLLTGMFMTACEDDVKVTHTYTYFEPVYATTSEIRDAFDVIAPQAITSSGKIYYLNGYIFLNEPGKGIHIINNEDPSNPVNEAFINIPGNFDMAAKGNILYADSYIDLLAIDISDLDNIEIKKRVENVFPIRYDFFYNGAESVVLTEYKEVRQVDVYEDDLGQMVHPGVFAWGHGFLATAEFSVNSFYDAGAPRSGGGSSSGVGGSMARFTIAGHYLYTVDSYNLSVFDIVNLDDPVAGNTVEISWDIETIFPYGDKLFIGSRAGMYIFNASNPESPYLLSKFEHVRSCDPVIADKNIAYVTLRSGTECEGFTNQLDVIDVTSLENPTLMKTFAMQNPHGLGKDDNLLFIAEGEYGLKVFDASDPLLIGERLLEHYDNIHAYDVIPLDGILLMTGDDGLFQYDYSDPENIQFLSKISVNASL